jgi:hypothetical protein
VAKSAKPPRCADYNGPHARWAPVGYEHVWLCMDCEYARRYGDAATGVAVVPWEMPDAPLQAERLF